MLGAVSVLSSGAPTTARTPGAASTAQADHPAELFAAKALSFTPPAGTPPEKRKAFLESALQFAHNAWPEKVTEAHSKVGVPLLPSKPTHVWSHAGVSMWKDTNDETYAKSGSPKGGDAVTPIVLAGWQAAGQRPGYGRAASGQVGATNNKTKS